MKVLTPGHVYELPSAEGGAAQTLRFIYKKPKPAPVPEDPDEVPGDPTFATVHDGTTTEEVIDMLIDRIECLNATVFDASNITAVTRLKDAKMALEARTKDRKARKVEGTPFA